MSSTVLLRIRYVVAAYGRPLALGLAVVGVVACGWTAAGLFAPDQTEEVAVETDRQTVTTTVNGSATVSGDSPFYERGTRLEDHPVYFTGATPNLTLRATTTASDADRLEVTHRVSLVLVGTVDGNEFWRSSEPVGTSRDSTASDGSVTTATTFDVAAFADGRLRTVRNEVGGVGQLDVYLRLDATYATGEYEGNLSVSEPLRVSGESYTFATPLSDDRDHSNTVTQQVTSPANPTPSTPLRAIVAVSTLLGSVVVFRTYEGGPDPERIAQRLEYEGYSEWISDGRIPADDDARVVTVDSIADVVDTGIDTGKRVIHDDRANAFAVIDGATIYRYEYDPDGEGGSPADSPSDGPNRPDGPDARSDVVDSLPERLRASVGSVLGIASGTGRGTADVTNNAANDADDDADAGR